MMQSSADARTRSAVRVDAALVAIVLLATVLRVSGLGSQSIWYDEWLSKQATVGSLSDVFRHVADRENIPPTYFVLLWGWTGLFGHGEFALRSISALAGIATVPVTYLAVRAFGLRTRVARIAALIVAVSPMLVWYSREARPYGLFMLMGAVTMLALARVYRDGDSADYWRWGLACGGAVAIHYLAIFLVVAEAVALVLIRRRQWQRVAISCGPTAVALVAFAPFALQQSSESADTAWMSKYALTYRMREAGYSALVGPTPPNDRLWLVSLSVAVVALVLLFITGQRRERTIAMLTIGIGVAAVALPLAAVVVEDVVLGRYLIAALIPLVIGVAIGLGVTKHGWLGLAGAAVVCAVSLVVVITMARDPALQKTNWRAVAATFNVSDSTRRVLVVNRFGNISSPLRDYLPDARALADDEPVEIDEIDVLASTPTDRP
jgi:uncharacterized membrane protein